ncbi:MAG: DEAD/DEAH box helicase [Natronospirillum sp.]|uniref:DEAD/DEAH box helicase n=1 Tax=Natronospirillum sp. TaxID=2812955 RepID=UPI0025D50546|nr:DEAD/DEAH box helicase [Natronospirillum sp.]MCH8550825.1 DEAD/DEAH box helicase [Natronospirillum sp.]
MSTDLKQPLPFKALPLPGALKKALDEMKFTECTPIQQQVLPFALRGRDCIGRAQTGTGKTAAFLLAVMSDLLYQPLPEQFQGEPRAVILAPTRELALQIAADAELLAQFTDLEIHTLVGGLDMQKQRKGLQTRHVDLLIATPGRLMDFVRQRAVFLDQTEVFVIDEADRMLDMGFIPDIKYIERAMPPSKERQTLLFSATFTQDILNLSERWTNNAEFVDIAPEFTTAEKVEQKLYLTSTDEKMGLLQAILEQEEVTKAIIFANRRDLVRKLFEKLKSSPHKVAMLSGEITQDKRLKTLAGFKTGDIDILVATDVAGRGLHVDDVSHVINFTLPEDPEDYVHRIGRTGRAGAEGRSYSFVCEDDAFLVEDLQKFIGQSLQIEHPPEHLMAHAHTG